MKKFLPLILVISLSACGLLPSRKNSISRDEQLNKTAEAVNIPTIEKELLSAGDAALAQGNYLKAESNYKQLIEKDGSNQLYLFKFAETHRRLGDCRGALESYDKLLAKEPDNLDYMESKGLCLVAQGEFDKAGPILTEVINKDDKRWKAVNAAGLIFAANNKYEEANQYFDAAADLSNDNPTVLNNQGLIRALLGNNDDAIKILSTASSRAEMGTTQRRNIDLNLAMVYGIAKKMAEAENTARPHLTEPQLYNNMGVYAQLAKDRDLARTYLDKALMRTPIYYDRAWENRENLGGK